MRARNIHEDTSTSSNEHYIGMDLNNREYHIHAWLLENSQYVLYMKRNEWSSCLIVAFNDALNRQVHENACDHPNEDDGDDRSNNLCNRLAVYGYRYTGSRIGKSHLLYEVVYAHMPVLHCHITYEYIESLSNTEVYDSIIYNIVWKFFFEQKNLRLWKKLEKLNTVVEKISKQT